MPTVLDSLDVPSPRVDGVSLVDVMRGRRSGLDLEAYSESLAPGRLGCAPLRSIRHGRFKLIDSPQPELYDLEQDPAEERNIYDERRATAGAMSTRLSAITGGRDVRAHESGAASHELRAQLAALGYVSSARPRSASDGAGAGETKACLAAAGVNFAPERPR
jgi:arylsulfatase A-like enzyme